MRTWLSYVHQPESGTAIPHVPGILEIRRVTKNLRNNFSVIRGVFQVARVNILKDQIKAAVTIW